MASFAKGLLASFINDLVEYGSYLGSLLYAPAVVAHAVEASSAAHPSSTPNFFIPFQKDYSTIEVIVQTAKAQDRGKVPQKVVQIGFHPTLPILHTSHQDLVLRIDTFISGYSFGDGTPRRISRESQQDLDSNELTETEKVMNKNDEYMIQRFAYSGKYSEGVFLAIIYIKKGTEKQILRIFRVDDEGKPTFVKETNLYDKKIRDVDHLSFSPLFPVLLLRYSQPSWFVLHGLFTKDDFIRVSVDSKYTRSRNKTMLGFIYIAFHPRLPIFAVSRIDKTDNIDIFNYSYNITGSVEVNFQYYLDLDPSISHTIKDITFHPDPDNIILAGIYTNTKHDAYSSGNQAKIHLFNLSAIAVDDSSRKVNIKPFDTIIPEFTPDSINFHSHIPFMSVLYQRSIRWFYVPGYVPGTKQIPHMELTIPELYKKINDDLDPTAVLFHPSLPYFAFAVNDKITIITFPVPNIPKESFQRHYGALARALSQKLATNPNPEDRKFHPRFMRSIVNQIVTTGGMTEDMIKMVNYYNPDLLQSDRLGRSTLVNPVLGRHETTTDPKLNTGPDYYNGEKMLPVDGGSKTRRKSKSKTIKKRRHSSIKKLRRRAKARTRTRTRTRK